MWLILGIIFGITYLYFRLVKTNEFWTRKGIKQGTPVLVFGDRWKTFTHKESLSELIERVYSVGGDDRYCGAYDFMSPALVLRDPDLIKDILVKDFDHFVDHKRVIPEGSDPIWDKNLFFLTGQKWKDMRSNVTPVFTGAKMRYLFNVMTDSTKHFLEYFSDKKTDSINIEVKDTFSRLTSDIIANAVFGFKTDSLHEKDSTFYQMTKKITDFGDVWQAIKLFGFFIFPRIYKELKIKILSTKISHFFYNIVQENIKSRVETKIQRPDMINLLMEARVNHKLIHGTEISDEDITAQALVFLFAGFDTVSSAMSFMAYELALNVNIQNRLIEEIDKVSNESNQKPTFEDINNMEYLDMVLSETLRKWPVTPFVTRICTDPYIIRPTCGDEKPVYLNTNDILFLPIYALHRDPKYFPNPEMFDPERFSEDNKKNIIPYTYVPFGSGPRKCIGYRFALLEIKILFYHILSQFIITTVTETQKPLRLCKTSINMTPAGGLNLGLKKRQL